jgi:hypothetical protein
VKRHVLVAVLAGALVALLPASALARPNDRLATKRFLAATTVWLRAVDANETASEAAVNAFIGHLGATCPSTLASDPNGTTAQQNVSDTFLVEAGLELGLTQLHARQTPALAFAGRLDALRWNDKRVGRAVASTVRQGRLSLALSPPDLCSEVAAAAAGGFAKVPPATAAFLAAARSALTSSYSVSDLLARMRPYITPAEKGTVSRLRRLEAHLNRVGQKFGQGAADRMVTALLGR